MKIGFVLDDGLDKPDGVQQYILSLGAEYMHAGHEVRYLVGQTKRTDIKNVYSMSRNVSVTFNGNKMSIPLPGSKKNIRRVLNKEAFDVLHIQVPYHPLMAARIIKMAPKDTVVVGTFHILPFGLISRVGTCLLGLWLKNTLRRFDAMVAVSAPAAAFAKQTFKVDCQVVPNSVLIKKFMPKKKIQKSSSFSILFLGRLVPRKGCKQLLAAVKQLQDQNALPAKTQITICGDGPDRSKLEAYVENNNLSGLVTFSGFVTEEQKISYMQQADIAVFPSLSGEAFGIVLIEAMAAGAGVVVGGNNPGYSSVLQPFPETLLHAKDPSIMARQLRKILDDSILRQQIHHAQQQYVAQFDTPKVADTLLNLYQTCKTAKNS